MSTVRHAFTSHWRVITLTLSIIIIFLLLYALRSIIWPFILGLIIAYVLLPAIWWIERRLPKPGKRTQLKRVSLVILVFIIFFALLGLLGFLIFTAVSLSYANLFNNAAKYISQAIDRLQQLTQSIRGSLPPAWQQSFDQLAQDISTSLGDFVRNLFLGGLAFIPSTFGFIAGLAALPFFLFYLLKDWEKLGRGFYSWIPRSASEHTRRVIAIIERVVGRYLRAQIVLMFVVGLAVFAGLMILGIPFAPALGVFAGLTELIPILGPWIGGFAGTIITLALAPDKVLWVIGLFVLVQVLENYFLVPRIQGGYLGIHPALTVVLLALGAYFSGFWGLILAVPVTATVIQIYKYVLQTKEAEDVADGAAGATSSHPQF